MAPPTRGQRRLDGKERRLSGPEIQLSLDEVHCGTPGVGDIGFEILRSDDSQRTCPPLIDAPARR